MVPCQCPMWVGHCLTAQIPLPPFLKVPLLFVCGPKLPFKKMHLQLLQASHFNLNMHPPGSWHWFWNLKCASWSVCTHITVGNVSIQQYSCWITGQDFTQILLSTLPYPNMNRCVVMLGNEIGQFNELSGKNWIALEREIETSLVNTQTLISCGWPADCINTQLLFKSHRYEI